MVLTLIAALTGLSLFAGLACLRLCAQRKSALGVGFVVIWLMHCVVGNLATLLSRDRTFTLLEFNEFAPAYLAAQLASLYFLLVYVWLLGRMPQGGAGQVRYRAEAAGTIRLFFVVALLFGLLLVQRIGVAEYFSPELAFFRAQLGEFAGAGVGVFYYLATFLVPATLMVCAFAMDHPRRIHIVWAVAALAVAVALFVPLGGRGRVVNLFFILGLAWLIRRNEYRLGVLLTPRVLLSLGVVLAVSYVWGVLRENPLAEVSTDASAVLRALSVDLTRLNVQAFVFDRYPLLGSKSPMHFVEATLGPFMQYLPLGAVNLVQDLSALWYHDTVGGVNVISAISPSLIGELYLTLGLPGVLAAPYLLYGLFMLMRHWMDTTHPLSLAVAIYFYQFTIYHGGTYAMFDVFVMTLPLLVLNRGLVRHGRAAPPASPASAELALPRGA